MKNFRHRDECQRPRHCEEERRSNPHVVEQTITTVRVDCFVAIAPRNDGYRSPALTKTKTKKVPTRRLALLIIPDDDRLKWIAGQWPNRLKCQD